MANISFYGSHNSAVAVENDGKILCVIEIERFLNVKNAGYAQYFVSHSRPYLLKEICKWINKTYGISEFENCYYLNTDTIEGPTKVFYEQLIPAKNYEQLFHHGCHAACGFYQTDYEESLIVSFDGGGNDGFFNIYHASDRNTIEEISRIGLDMGFPYMSFGDYLKDIKMEPALNIGNLVYSGKIMGLCSYGKLRKDWLEPMKEYYLSKPDGLNYLNLLSILGKKIGIEFNTNNRLEGELAWDLAKTSQVAFEEVTIELITPYLEKFPNIPLVMVGGCALNILLNTRLKKELGREVFIPPNPNDCGIAAGLLLSKMKPKKGIDLTYSGIPVLDQDTLMSICENNFSTTPLEIRNVVKDLQNGKIIGVVRGNSEHGPRALGNRSILCDPTKEGMKDILNQKVKHREWYRPFAPVVRLEDVSKYFDFQGESRWMSFCPQVKDEWKDVLKSITHVDGTARVQTVTKDQNPWLYELITEFEKVTGVGVLLNTSFNVDGRPILSTFRDALDVYNKTELDSVILENYYIKK
jgi:carbamoyltransferase